MQLLNQVEELNNWSAPPPLAIRILSLKRISYLFILLGYYATTQSLVYSFIFKEDSSQFFGTKGKNACGHLKQKELAKLDGLLCRDISFNGCLKTYANLLIHIYS
jgi:hypothetical protein